MNNNEYYYDHFNKSEWHLFLNCTQFSDCMTDTFKFDLFDIIIKLGEKNQLFRQGEKLKINDKEYMFLCAGRRFHQNQKRLGVILVDNLDSGDPNVSIYFDLDSVIAIHPPLIADVLIENFQNLMRKFVTTNPTITQTVFRVQPNRVAKNEVKDSDFDCRNECEFRQVTNTKKQNNQKKKVNSSRKDSKNHVDGSDNKNNIIDKSSEEEVKKEKKRTRKKRKHKDSSSSASSSSETKRKRKKKEKDHKRKKESCSSSTTVTEKQRGIFEDGAKSRS